MTLSPRKLGILTATAFVIVTSIALVHPIGAAFSEERATNREISGGHPMSGMMNMHGQGAIQTGLNMPTLPGQDAFGAIQEIVLILQADAAADWSKVDLEALRQHLIDMHNVTLSTKVSSKNVGGGIRFHATGDAPAVAASISRMVTAHVRTMDGVNGWRLEAAEIPGGATLTVTPANASDLDKIRGLGFIGVMTVGMHHQEHHLAIASGRSPH